MRAWTDGSYRNGKGGYGVVLIDEDGKEQEISGAISTDGLANGKITNQRAELIAIIAALYACKKDMVIYSDSMYAVNCLSGKFKIKANQDLMNTAFDLMKNRKVSYVHVKGHNGDAGNEKADKLAQKWTS